MDTYSLFREIADSWGLLGMMIFFSCAILMLFRPSAKQQHKDASQIPFRNEKMDQEAPENKTRAQSSESLT
jgi:cytochrome c oxidase cbb3-type subunit 4